MMYEIYGSTDYGVTYDKILSTDKFDDIKLLLEFLDRIYVRWYLAKDGKEIEELMCRVYEETICVLGLKTDYMKNCGNYEG